MYGASILMPYVLSFKSYLLHACNAKLGYQLVASPEPQVMLVD